MDSKTLFPFFPRVSLGLFLLYIGIMKFIEPASWLIWVNNITAVLITPVDLTLFIIATIEVVFGLLLVLGLFTRFIAFLSAVLVLSYVTLFIFNYGFNEFLAQNLVIFAIALSLSFKHDDSWSLDNYITKKFGF